MIIYFDLLVVITLLLFLIKEKQLMFLNPSVLYLLIHIMFVTWRGVQIFIMDKAIVSNTVYDSIITEDEIVFAIFVADLGIISFFLGFNLFKNKFFQKGMRSSKFYPVIYEKRQNVINIYTIIITVLGIVGLLFFAFIPGKQVSDFESSILTQMLANLSIISALVLIYQQGFSKKNTVFFFILIIIYLLQGYARFRAILPLVFVLLYYLKLFKLRIPPLKYVLVGTLLFLMSIPAKQVAMDLQSGESIDLINVIEKSFTEVSQGESGELALIEQSAAMISSVDMKAKIFYGETYTPILFFFVPRSLWPEKPALNQWQYEISDAGRNYAEMGQISTITGEAYANFRIPGVVFILMLVGIFYSYLFFTFGGMNIQHRGFLLLLLFNMILFQVWRDGMISLFLFPLLNYLPITILYFLKKHPKLIAKATTNQ